MAYLRRYLIGNSIQSGPSRSGGPVTAYDPRQRSAPSTTPGVPATPTQETPTPVNPLQAGSGEPGTLRAFFLANRGEGQRQAEKLNADLDRRLDEAEAKIPTLTQDAPPTPQGMNPPDLDPGVQKQREDILSPIRDDINIAGQPGGAGQLLAKDAGPGYTPTMSALDAWLLQGAGFNVDPYKSRLQALEGLSPYRIPGAEAAPDRNAPKPGIDKEPDPKPAGIPGKGPDWDQRPKRKKEPI